MKVVCKITCPNGKIYLGMDLADSIDYFGSASSALIAKVFNRGERMSFVIRKDIIWKSETATDEEVRRKEIELILHYRLNAPETGCKVTPKRRKQSWMKPCPNQPFWIPARQLRSVHCIIAGMRNIMMGGRPVVLQALMLACILWSAFLCGGCGRSRNMEGKVIWSDPVGDVRSPTDYQDRPISDLQEVVLGSENGELVAELDIRNLRKRLDYVSGDGKRHGASLLDILLDTDLDETTGGAPLSLWRMDQKPARFGYEFRVAVLAGFRCQSADGGSGRTVGDVSFESAKYTKIEPIIKYQIWALGSQRFGSKNIELSEADDARHDTELAVLDNDRVRLRIPYNYLGIKSGGKVRVAYLDVQESASTESSLSEDKVMTLK